MTFEPDHVFIVVTDTETSVQGKGRLALHKRGFTITFGGDQHYYSYARRRCRCGKLLVDGSGARA
jgi:hypothetical protein